MEDPEYGVFNSKDDVVYKSILPSEMVADIISIISSKQDEWKDGATGLATGIRPFLELNLAQDFPWLIDHLHVVLSGYFPDMIISTDARFYNHQLGGVKPHRDGNRDGHSNYTLLIYLSDQFEGGNLSIKTVRSEQERLEYEPDKYHNVFTLTPRIGYGVVFSKSLLHWASDVIDGHKNFLVLHLWSDF